MAGHRGPFLDDRLLAAPSGADTTICTVATGAVRPAGYAIAPDIASLGRVDPDQGGAFVHCSAIGTRRGGHRAELHAVTG